MSWANDRIYTAHDILRTERKILKMIIDLPENLIDQLNQIIEEDTE